MTMRVVVLTCQPFGIDTARAIGAHPSVASVELVTAPLPRPSLRVRLRRSIRAHGVLGTIIRQARSRLSSLGPGAGQVREDVSGPTVTVRRFADLHDPDCLTYLQAAQFDLGVVDGTGILKPVLFRIPRLGCINIHCGKLPDYRGAPPAFWELLHGEPVVGVSVHEVSETLDAGRILAETTVPLNLAPSGDPVAYAREVWLEQLRPAGIRLVLEVIGHFANGTVVGREQPPFSKPPNRAPSIEQQQELREVVRLRRQSGAHHQVMP